MIRAGHTVELDHVTGHPFVGDTVAWGKQGNVLVGQWLVDDFLTDEHGSTLIVSGFGKFQNDSYAIDVDQVDDRRITLVSRNSIA